MNPSSKRLQFPRTVIRLVSYLLILLPIAFGFLYVRWFGINLAGGDSWTMISFFTKLSSGTLGILDLLALHNDHWVFFPRIAMLSLGWMTEWNSIAEYYFIQALRLGTLVCLLLAFRESIKAFGTSTEPDSINTRSAFFFPLLLVPISFLVFHEGWNRLRGFLMTFAFVELFGILALYLLYVLRHESLRKVVFVAALGSAIVASFSSVQGLLVWPVGLLQLFISPVEKRTKRVFIALWGLVGLGVWIAYFITRANDRAASRESETSEAFSALAYPLEVIESFLKLLGNPLFGKNLAFATGLFLACLVVVSLILVYKDRRRLGEYSFWISYLFWSSLILASVAVGRFEPGSAVPLRGRYIAFGMLVIVGIYGLLATAAFRRGLSIRISSISTILPSISTISLVLLSGLVLLSAGMSYPEQIASGRKEKERREEQAYVILTYESQPEEVLDDQVGKRKRQIPDLESLGYNVFSESSNGPSSSGGGP